MRNFVLLTVLTLLITLSPQGAVAQSLVGCTASNLTDPPRIVYQCEGGVVLEAEAAAALGIVTSGADNRPTDVDVSSDAVLIEVAPGSGPFQIRTPHAIAAVRGTVYAVDVEDGKTAVFVSEGEVAVSRPDGSDQVLLGQGFGVDVAPGEPLVAREWGAERVRNLLSRFGR
ncbi:FecR domain-containing protein [Roseibium sp. HPY-6]|uniref:FecR domain-containing protein n=1 Tax=Roseibium sp. HPY-6 TaxID=3229852 RepID=UPI00338DD143